jgi:hypothetical protein
MGKCPKCDRLVSQLLMEEVMIRAADGFLRGVSYLCSSCHYVVSAAIDPVALKADCENIALEG